MIVVTGGAGFIGSNIVADLDRRGHDIVVVDDLADERKRANLAGIDVVEMVDKDEFLARLTDRGALEGVSAVIHQGACSSTTESDVDYVMRTNYEYSMVLADACLRAAVPLIYASSAAVYGNSTDQRDEAGNEHPLNVYGRSKALFDQHVRDDLAGTATQIVGLRYFNVYGPHEDHKDEMASLVLQLDDQLEATGEARIFGAAGGFGPGEQRRDFVSVDDIVSVVRWFLDRPDRSGLFNCGTGTSRTFAELAGEVIRCRGAGTVRHVPFPDALIGRYQFDTRADLTRLRAAGCDHEFAPIEVGVERYLAWRHRVAATHVILDRDGVLNREPASGWVTDAAQWEWETGALDALDLLAASGVRVSIVTNQSCIGRGLVAADVVERLHSWLAAELRARGVDLVGIFVCPHAPDAGCACRKPGAALFEQAIAESGVSAARTVAVGDDVRDVEAARAAGVRPIVVLTGKGRATLDAVPDVERHHGLRAAIAQSTWERFR